MLCPFSFLVIYLFTLGGIKMRFPHAYKGVKKLFIVEIISIISGLIGLTAAILAVVGANNENGALVAAAGTIALVSGIALIVAFVLQLVGLIQAGKDESSFRIALWVILIAIVLSIVTNVLVALPQDPNGALTLVSSILSAVASVANVIVTIYILSGITILANELKDSAMAAKGKLLVNVVTVLFVISIALSLLPRIFVNGVPTPFTAMFDIFSIAAAVIEVCVYIAILIYYYFAIKMLKK